MRFRAPFIRHARTHSLTGRRSVAAGATLALSAAMFAGVGAATAPAASGAPALGAVTAPMVALPSARRSASYTDSAGTRSTYHLFTSSVSGPVKGLAVYLDGDGMYGHDNPNGTWALGGSKGVVAQAGARGYATLSVRTPDSSGTFWRNGAKNAAYVTSLIEQIRKETGTSATWLVGYSGGSQLITQFLLPAHSAKFTAGGAVITGGGGTPRSVPAPFAAESKANFPLHWYTGSLDDGRNTSDGYDALADAKRGAAYYAGQGFRTSREEPAGIDHSGLGTRFGTAMAAQIDRFAGSTATPTTPVPTTPTVPAPTTPAPTTPTAPAPTTPTTPSPSETASESWPVTVSTSRRSARVKTRVPSRSRHAVSLVVTSPDGRRITQTTRRSGSVTFELNGIASGTTYSYELRQGDAVKASGSFTTSRGR